MVAQKRAWYVGDTGFPAACMILKSQLHAYYSSPGMKPSSHVASPLPQHRLAYLSHAVPSASHCCQKCRAGLLITCQWAWREGRSGKAHPGAKRDARESWKSQQAFYRWASLPVRKGPSEGFVKPWSQKGVKEEAALEEVWGPLSQTCAPNPAHHLL